MSLFKPILVFSAFAFACGVFAQDVGSPAFAATSIKRNLTPSNGTLRGSVIVCQGVDETVGRPAFVNAGPVGSADPVPQGRCRGANVTLQTLVATAYSVSERDVSGGEGWISSAGFQVDAVAERTEAVTAEELRQMVRTMLANRFQLKVRRQETQSEGFALTASGNRSKLSPATGNEQPLHIELTGQRGQQQVSILGQSSIADFASILTTLPFTATILGGLRVIDTTGLKGLYNFNIVFHLVQGTTGAPASDPPLENALQDQAGLRLESRKIPVQAIVIEHAEMPSEN
jgi:uncharacterized protein (TIGR03435 family)